MLIFLKTYFKMQEKYWDVGKEICERKCAVRRRDGSSLPGWWLRRGMILFVSYSQWARNQPSTFKTRRMTILRSYVLIILISLMHMMFTRTSRNEGRLRHMVFVTFVCLLCKLSRLLRLCDLHDLCALCEFPWVALIMLWRSGAELLLLKFKKCLAAACH